MQPVALIDKILGGRAVLLARSLKVLQLFGFQRSNHVEPRAILEFLKAHLLTPSSRRRSFSSLVRAWFLPCPRVYSYEKRFRAGSSPEKMQVRLLAAGLRGGN